MAVAIRSTSLGAFTSGTTRATSAPTGKSSGDALLLFFYVEANVTIATPSGWSVAIPKHTETSEGWTAIAFSRVADGTAADTPTITWGGSNKGNVYVMAAYTGCDQTTPVNVAASAFRDNSTASTSAVVDSVTTTTANCLAVSVVFNDNGGVVTPGTGWTEDRDSADGIEVAHKTTIVASAGAVGSVTHTINSSRTQTAMLALQPPQATVVTGTAALSGTSTIAASGQRVVLGSAALTGSASVAASGVRIALGSAALAGSGVASATGVVTRFGAAALDGTGALDASGVRTTFDSAALSGSGVLTASALSSITGSAALVGSGVLAASGLRIVFDSAALSGTGTLQGTVPGIPTVELPTFVSLHARTQAVALQPYIAGGSLHDHTGSIDLADHVAVGDLHEHVAGLDLHEHVATADLAEREQDVNLYDHDTEVSLDYGR